MRLTGDAFERNHPFKKFHKKRGRVGTRFTATLADITTGGLIFNGEVMLASWGDAATTGQSIRLWIDDEAESHPFAGYARRQRNLPGDMFALVMVELNDEEQAVDQHAEDRQRKARALSSDAHLMVTSEMFVRYLTEMKSHIRSSWDAKQARDYVKGVLEIESLSDLDRNPEKARAFHEQVRKPYARWNQQEA